MCVCFFGRLGLCITKDFSRESGAFIDQHSEDRREAWVLDWSMVLTNLVPRSHSSMSGFLRTRSSPPLLCHSYKRNFPVVKVKIFPFSRDRVSANGLPQNLPKKVVVVSAFQREDKKINRKG